MKRYYLSEIVTVPSELGPVQEPALASAGVNFVAIYPPRLADGSFSKTHCLALVNTTNHAKLLSDARNKALPDAPLDVKVSAVRTQTMQGLENTLRDKGFTVTWSQSDGYRDVVRSIGRQLEAIFDEDAFDVSE